ncbi:hypothetical protein ACFSTC_00775 [Nonomuraea ferruginea]
MIPIALDTDFAPVTAAVPQDVRDALAQQRCQLCLEMSGHRHMGVVGTHVETACQQQGPGRLEGFRERLLPVTVCNGPDVVQGLACGGDAFGHLTFGTLPVHRQQSSCQARP